jgi:hypothetical protein
MNSICRIRELFIHEKSHLSSSHLEFVIYNWTFILDISIEKKWKQYGQKPRHSFHKKHDTRYRETCYKVGSLYWEWTSAIHGNEHNDQSSKVANHLVCNPLTTKFVFFLFSSWNKGFIFQSNSQLPPSFRDTISI